MSMPRPGIKRDDIHRALIDSLRPALTVGAGSGAAGLIVGGFGGLAFSQTPVLFATVSGLQWFGVGSTFWYIRSVTTQVSGSGSITNWESVVHSAFAGSVAGAVNGSFTSRAKVRPGAFMFGILGILGQAGYNAIQTDVEETPSKLPFTQRLLASRWVPLKRLSDEDYVEMLNEKTIKIDAEIALIDEKIATLQKSRIARD